VTVGGDRGTGHPVPSSGTGRAVAEGPGFRKRHPPREPRAVFGGAVPGAVRRRRPTRCGGPPCPLNVAVRGRRSRSVGRSPRTVVAILTARKAVRSGVIWGYIFGIAIASSAISYTTIYKTQAQRDALAAAYGSNKATSALFGPAPDLQTVAGFTVFKISMTLMILGAVWGLLTSTRLLRGEEDSGRWELLLTGQTTRKGCRCPGSCRSGSRRLRAVGAHRADHGSRRPGLEGGHRGRSGPLLRPGHGGDGVSCSWPSVR
jgi:hypothetical protein